MGTALLKQPARCAIKTVLVAREVGDLLAKAVLKRSAPG
jgi:hypothetical protein